MLKIVGLLEGISFLVLLLICMPLKYMMNIPEGVKLIGPIHGFLFVAYCFLVIYIGMQRDWSFKIILFCLLASVLPFGTFIADRKYNF